MKKYIRVTGVAVLTVIYCLAISVITLPLVPAASDIGQTAGHATYTPDLPAILSSHLAQAEGFGHHLTNYTAPGLKNTLTDHWSIVKTIGLLIETSFAQYHNFSATLLINHRKSDIIFPFQYFW